MSLENLRGLPKRWKEKQDIDPLPTGRLSRGCVHGTQHHPKTLNQAGFFETIQQFLQQHHPRQPSSKQSEFHRGRDAPPLSRRKRFEHLLVVCRSLAVPAGRISKAAAFGVSNGGIFHDQLIG